MKWGHLYHCLWETWVLRFWRKDQVFPQEFGEHAIFHLSFEKQFWWACDFQIIPEFSFSFSHNMDYLDGKMAKGAQRRLLLFPM